MVQKCDVDEWLLPIPTQIVSNEGLAKFNEAEAVYRKMLETRPNSGFAYIGIAKAMTKAGNRQKSDEAARQLASVWRNADKDLIQIKGSTH